MITVGVIPTQLTSDVNAGNAAPAGVAVCAQETVAVVVAAPGAQLIPIAGAFAPSVAGAVMVRLAPEVIAKAELPAGTVQASAKLLGALPAIVTVTGTVPEPADSVAVAAIVAVGGTPPMAPCGQNTVEVSGGKAAPAGVSVCVQVSVTPTCDPPGIQLKPIAGGFAPTAAGALMVRLAPVVMANATVLGGIVQANATLAFAMPAVATVTVAVPRPVDGSRVTFAGSALSVGATGVAVPAGQVKPQTRDTGAPAPAVSVQVKVAVPDVAARVQPRSMVPAVVT